MSRTPRPPLAARLRAPWNHRASIVTALFALGAALAHAHLAVSLELSVTLTYHGSLVRSLLLFIYPLGVAVVGVGAVIEGRLGARAAGPRTPLHAARLAGLALLLFFALALRVNFFVASTGELVAVVLANTAALALWFLLVGVAVAGLLRRARDVDGRFVARAWAAHLIGLLVGYATADFLVYRVGVNAMLACVGAALAIAPRLFVPAAAALLAVAAAVGADARIEALRDLGPLLSGRLRRLYDGPQKEYKFRDYGDRAGARLVFRGWSRYTQVRVLELGSDDERVLTGYYNFYHQWNFKRLRSGSVRGNPHWALRRAIYGAAGPGDRVVVLAVGAGLSAYAFDFPLHPGVVLVELDDALVRFLRDERPDLNDHIFRRAHAIAREGRHVVETSAEPLDFIIVESARFRPAWVSDPVGSADTLYTREALGMYLGKLRPSGVLVVYFTEVRRLAEDEYYPVQVLRSLRDRGTPHRVFATRRTDHAFIALVASPTAAGLARVEAHVSQTTAEAGPGEPRVGGWTPLTTDDPRHGRRLTDATPFAHWARMDDASRRALQTVAAGLAAALLLLGALAARGSRAALGWPAGAYFFLIGVAQTALQIGTIYAFRTYYGDAVTTTVRVLVWFLVFGAAGAMLAPRVLGLRAGPVVAVVVVAGLMALHVGSFRWIPFQWGHAALREAAAAALLLPGGLLMGVFFPAGLARAQSAWVGRLLLADALGTLFGYAAFYLVFLTAGRDAFAVAAAATYVAAAWLLVQYSARQVAD